MLNSDAHRPDRLDNYFEQAREMIKNAGYRDIKILIDKNWENDRLI
jgi:histidinol phosphatase-like PHP family hydrolase